MGKKLEYIRKRDGRTVPFDKQKISDAIFKSAQSVGGQDRYLADDLAEVVKMYLESSIEYKGDIPSVEDIQDVVERVLIKTGHARTAKAYILYRQKRTRARKIREGFSPEDLSERESERAIIGREVNLQVRRSDDNVSLWDKNRIVDALVRETSIPKNIAELIVMEVEEEIIASKVKKLSSTLIRELVNAKLVQYGFEEERRKHTRLGLPFYDVKTLFEGFPGLPDELSMEFGRSVKREFAMNAVLPDTAVEKHLKGEISICNREGIDRCYSARIPVMVETGTVVNDIKETLKTIGPFIEHNLVLSFSENAPLSTIEETEFSFSKDLSIEIPIALASEDLIQGTGKQEIPVCFRIEDKQGLDKIVSISGKTPEKNRVSIFSAPTNSGILVLNHITLNLSIMNAYAEQEGLSLKDYIKPFIPLCSEILERQTSFLSSNRVGSKFLKTFESAKRTVEVEFRDVFQGDTDFVMDLGFIDELLDMSLSFVIEVPVDGESKNRLFCSLNSLFEQQRTERQKKFIRITNV